MRKLGSWRWICALWIVGLVAGGCARDPLQEAQIVLNTREQALNEQNLALYMSVISPEYGGSPTQYGAVKERAERLFADIDRIRYTSFERSMYTEPDGRIRVVQRFTMELEREGRTSPLSGREQLFLIPDAQRRYRIVEGL